MGTGMIDTDEITSVAESLPIELKAELIERLLYSMSPSQKDIDKLWAQEAETRLSSFFAG
jgi:hypothetical protein